MGRRGKDLTPEVKKITLNLLNESYSGHKISQVVGVIPRTVKKNLKRVRERGNPPPDQADREKRTYEVTEDFFGWSGKAEGKH